MVFIIPLSIIIYNAEDLTNSLIELVDNTLDNYPVINTVIVVSGDLNKFDLNQLQHLSGWSVLGDFPTRGNACVPVDMLMKTDHRGIILHAGKKLEPVRKVIIRNCREHRTSAFYQALVNEKCNEIFDATYIDLAVNTCRMKEIIHSHLNICMPLKVVSMSTRDPVWMNPLVKYMMKTKSRISSSNNGGKEWIPYPKSTARPEY